MKLKHTLLAAAAFVGLAGTAFGEEDDAHFLGGKFSANVALTTDYTFRGISQTFGDPAVQGGIDWANDHFYGGFWASTVNFNDSFAALSSGVAADLGISPGLLDTGDSSPSDGSQIEIDLFAGFTHSFGDLGLDVGVIYYLYAGAPQESDDVIVADAETLGVEGLATIEGLGLAPGDILLDFPDQDYVEIHVAGTYPIGPAEIGFNLTYSPDYYFETGDVLIPDLSVSFPIGSGFEVAGSDLTFSFSSNIGYLAFLDNDIDDGEGFGEDYWDFGVGVTATWYGIDFDARYIDTFSLAGNGSTGVFTISTSF